MTTTTDYQYYMFLGANMPSAGTGQFVVTTHNYAGTANDLVLPGASVHANGAVTWHTGSGDTQATYTGFTAPDGGPIIMVPPVFAGQPDQYYALSNMLYSPLTPVAATSFACFLRGTDIATPDGPVAVENLVAGQMVTRAQGGAAEIVWIGWRTLEAPDAAARPVRVRAHAFGFDQPGRDLFLSPEHAVFAAGSLIPIKALIDGDAIAAVERDSVTYFHILLQHHEIILAEGLACESLLDIDEPANFANADTAPPSLAFLQPCAPIVTQGAVVEMVRARIRSRQTMAV